MECPPRRLHPYAVEEWFLLGEHPFIRGGDGSSFTTHEEGNALSYVTGRAGICQKRPVGGAHEIDEPWRYDVAARVETLARGSGPQATDRGDPTIANADVSVKPRVPCSVDHATIADDQVERRATGRMRRSSRRGTAREGA
jgi:hypothetical protein